MYTSGCRLIFQTLWGGGDEVCVRNREELVVGMGVYKDSGSSPVIPYRSEVPTVQLVGSIVPNNTFPGT